MIVAVAAILYPGTLDVTSAALATGSILLLLLEPQPVMAAAPSPTAAAVTMLASVSSPFEAS